MSRIQFISFLIISIFIWVPCKASVWKNAVSQVNADIKQMNADIEETQNIISKERRELKSELSGLDDELVQREKSFKELKEKFEDLLKIEENLRNEIEAGEENARELAEILRTSAKDADTMSENSIITAEKPSRRDVLIPLSDPERFPGMDDIENLAEMLFAEMRASREIRKRTGIFVNEQGNETRGEIIRIGKFTTLYKDGEKTGYLRFDRASQKLTAVPGKLPGSVQRAVKSYFKGESDHVPLDLSGGIIAEQISKTGNLFEQLKAGGFLVYPILFIAVTALILSLERLWSLGRIPVQTDNIMDSIRKMAHKNDWKACRELCGKHPEIPACNVLKAGLEYQGKDREVLENAVEESILKELPRLERFLTTLSVLAAISPLLGLLGTVTGMIHTFQGITVFGTSDPRMMSGGISEALITTQLGLAVAIPIMIAHHIFDRRVEKIIGDMEEKGTSLITIIINSRSVIKPVFNPQQSGTASSSLNSRA